MPAPRKPVEKLPLPVRKNMRDEFESKIGTLQSKMAGLGFPDCTFATNPNLVYAYAEERSYGQNSLGACIYKYFEAFVDRLADYVKKGQDTESIETLKKVAPKNVVNLVPDDEGKNNYNGIQIRDDQIWLSFNHSCLGTNISQVGDKISEAIDAALEAKGGADLPLSIRRFAAQYLEPAIPDLQKKLEKIFQRPYTLVPDLEKNYAYLKANKSKLSSPDYLDRLPQTIKSYFEGVVSAAGWKKFETDEMLRDAFNEAAENGVIRFVVVEKLEFGNYNDAVFEDGECRVRTIPEKFAYNTSQSFDNILDRL